MNASPILMHARSIQNLLAGRKVQTRRIVKPQPHPRTSSCWRTPTGWEFRRLADTQPSHGLVNTPADPCPYGQPGDLLVVRETWKPHSLYAAMKPREMPHAKVFYRADDSYAPSNTPWKPAIHMPRWASRLTLELTDVRVERVQQCSEADIAAEGVQFGPSAPGMVSAAQAWRTLWEDTNGTGAWERNDWVWALTFKVHRANVDGMLLQRAPKEQA